MTTNHIAEVAGVSIGTLDQYFPNKESIFAALVHRYGSTIRSSVDTILPEVESQPLQVVVRRLIEVAVAQRLDQPELAREIEVLDRTLPRPAATTAGHQRDQRFRRLLEAHRGELAITDIPLAMLFCKNAVKASLHDILIARPAVTKEAVTDELTAMVLRYLTGRSA